MYHHRNNCFEITYNIVQLLVTNITTKKPSIDSSLLEPNELRNDMSAKAI